MKNLKSFVSKSISKKTIGFPDHHPGQSLSPDLRLIYFQLLTLNAADCQGIGKSAQEFLNSAGKGLGLSDRQIRVLLQAPIQRRAFDVSRFIEAIDATSLAHHLVLEATLLSLSTGPVTPAKVESLSELMAMFRYSEERTEWTVKLALAVLNRDKRTAAECFASPPTQAPTLETVAGYAPGFTIEANTLEEERIKTGKKLELRKSVEINRDLYIEQGAHLTIADSSVKILGNAQIICHGSLIFFNSSIQAFQDGENKNYPIIHIESGGSLQFVNSRISGATKRPGIWALSPLDLSIFGSTFTDCYERDGSGGALYIGESDEDDDEYGLTLESISISDCHFFSCKSEKDGQAIYVYQTSTSPFLAGESIRIIRRCSFKGCGDNLEDAVRIEEDPDCGDELELDLSDSTIRK
jgi:hypothetical protein